MEDNNDVLYKDTRHVKRGEIKIQSSYIIKSKIRKIISTLLFLIVLAFIVCISLLVVISPVKYHGETKDTFKIRGEYYTLRDENTTELDKGDIVVIKPKGKDIVTRSVIYATRPTIYKIKSTPYSYVTLDGVRKQLPKNKFQMECVSNCSNEKMKIIDLDNIGGVLH